MKIIFKILIFKLITQVCVSQENKKLQQKFDEQIIEVISLSKNGALEEAIKKGEEAKLFAFENFKDSNHNQKNILFKLNFFYRIINDEENELRTNSELGKLRSDDLKLEKKTFLLNCIFKIL